jgi:hypothetical protein
LSRSRNVGEYLDKLLSEPAIRHNLRLTEFVRSLPRRQTPEEVLVNCVILAMFMAGSLP